LAEASKNNSHRLYHLLRWLEGSMVEQLRQVVLDSKVMPKT